MKRNILIPTDFSANAWNALNYAVHLYKKEECDFYLLNAYQVFDFPSEILLPLNSTEKRFSIARQVSEKGLQKIMNKLEARNSNPLHKFIPLSIYDRLLPAVRWTLENHHLDLIIMGTRGENNLSIREFGSNAVEVMENIKKIPIMAVPLKAPVFINGNKKEIVFSASYKTPYKQKDLDFLLETAKLFKADIRVLHIQENGGLNPEQQENKDFIKRALEGTRHSFHTLSNVKVASGIHSFIKSRGSDMLTMIHKKHSFLNSIFSAPLVEQLNEKQQVPLLVLHE